ncbi:MAG: phosphoenolpyruvate mutase [Eubacteriales bacterium]
MKALLLNSGLGKRMGILTSEHPKCMTEVSHTDTILSRQLKQLQEIGVEEVIITTGLYDQVLRDYVESLELPTKITYVHNDKYDTTNYIYSMYCAKEVLKGSDMILIHGDMVFENRCLETIVESNSTSVAVSTTASIPEKDFKAVIRNGRVSKIGIEFFKDVVASQPLYYFTEADFAEWMNEIGKYCESSKMNCYAENALNDLTETLEIHPVDMKDLLCGEIDMKEDLDRITKQLQEIDNKTVYLSFSTDMIHSGHIAILKKASKLGKVIVGVLSDEVVASYKRFPLLPYEERKELFENLGLVSKVVEQQALSYKEVLMNLQPDYVVHGDDWITGFQQNIRKEVIEVLATYGGTLVEYPYAKDDKYKQLDDRSRAELATPDARRRRLQKMIAMKGCISAIESHSGLTGLIAEKTVVEQDGKAFQFDAMWVSSLCDSTAKGKPDIELLDMSSRFQTIDDIMEVTTKPIIFDGDTGGLTEHFVYTVKTLERMGVSMIIIEDKTGLKKNSLFGTEVEQTQDSIENFSAKIAAGKKAQKTQEFMIVARIESLILEQGMEDALERAFAFTKAGADGIMIHSRRKEPDEIFEFVKKFRVVDQVSPIVVVPTSFNEVTEEEFKERGVNVVIYANQLTRSAFPAMQEVAQMILTNHRAKEADDRCLSIKEIINLIPEEL